MDGYGTNEVIESDGKTVETDEASRPIIRGNSLYTIVDGPSWTEAEANAMRLGGHLTTINNIEEYRWAAKYFWTPTQLDGLAFIGFNDAKNEGQYQ